MALASDLSVERAWDNLVRLARRQGCTAREPWKASEVCHIGSKHPKVRRSASEARFVAERLWSRRSHVDQPATASQRS